MRVLTPPHSGTATAAAMMVGQVQFLTLLGSTQAANGSSFASFADSLKWANLQIPMAFSSGVSGGGARRRLAQDAWSDDDAVRVLVGNTIMIAGGLLALCVAQLLYGAWLKARALGRLGAQSCDPSGAVCEDDLVAYHSMSENAWFYFPRYQLVWLLFSYQGAVQAQAAALNSGRAGVIVFAAALLLLYPAAMLVYTTHLVSHHLACADPSLMFEKSDSAQAGGLLKRACKGIATAWAKGESILDWGVNGAWHAATGDETHPSALDSRRLRIGFEPLFVDYTQMGSWLISWELLRMLFLGLIAGLLTAHAAPVAACFLAASAAHLLLVLALRPYGNVAMTALDALLAANDTASAALLLVAATAGSGAARAAALSGMMILSLIALATLTVPIYMDTAVVTSRAVVAACRRCCCRQAAGAERAQRQQRQRAAAPPLRQSVALMQGFIREDAKAAARAAALRLQPPRVSSGDYAYAAAACVSPMRTPGGSDGGSGRWQQQQQQQRPQHHRRGLQSQRLQGRVLRLLSHRGRPGGSDEVEEGAGEKGGGMGAGGGASGEVHVEDVTPLSTPLPAECCVEAGQNGL
ncbi:hypothetical protein JKP88DRAFT_278032 [Tribonema minus]|uniref:Uncharacterized protein n=1 Tax=Tribonema minus TaxID=303371 RepID=A0A836CFX2_9STRA|nr:hypothetical protein JKP88DRAFT_278032 [Tribonema minus]